MNDRLIEWNELGCGNVSFSQLFLCETSRELSTAASLCEPLLRCGLCVKKRVIYIWQDRDAEMIFNTETTEIRSYTEMFCWSTVLCLIRNSIFDIQKILLRNKFSVPYPMCSVACSIVLCSSVPCSSVRLFVCCPSIFNTAPPLPQSPHNPPATLLLP